MLGKFKIILEMLNQVNYLLDQKTKRASIFVFINILIAAMLETLGVSAIIPFIQAMINPEQIASNKYIKIFIQLLSIDNNFELLVVLAFFVICIYVLKNAYLIFSTIVQVRFQTQFQKKLATDMLKSYLSRPYTYFIEVNSADMMRGITTDIIGINRIVDNIFKLLAEVVTVFFIGIYIFITDPFIAIGILSVAVLCVLLITLVIKKNMNIAGKKYRDSNALVNKYAYQAFNGIKEISVMNRRDNFITKYEDANDEMRKAEFYFSVIAACPKRIIETVFIAAIIILVCIKVGMGGDVVNYIPMLAALALAGIRILPSISSVSGYIANTIYLRHSLNGAYENFHAAREYGKELLLMNKDKEVNEEKIDQSDFKAIEVNQITWKYNNSPKVVLNGLSLKIYKGESVALIGESGAGKTTLADVLLGLLKPISGELTIDGKDVSSIPAQWSKMIGYVPQTVFLMDDTIRNNILFGIEEGNDAQVWKALEKAQLKEYVQGLPKGLDTIVGERGIKFSGGQRQRIAIARALYYDPSILVMDEATSALDSETESAVMEAIEALQGEKTLIIVAHRITTIKNCDKVYEVKDGKIVERIKEEVISIS